MSEKDEILNSKPWFIHLQQRFIERELFGEDVVSILGFCEKWLVKGSLKFTKP